MKCKEVWGWRCNRYVFVIYFFFFKQKTAYEIVSRDWSSDVCSSDLETLPLQILILLVEIRFDAAQIWKHFPPHRLTYL